VGFAVDAAKAKGTLGEKCPANAAGVPVCSDKEFTQADVDGLNGRKNRGFPAAWGLGAAGVLGVAAAIVGVATAGRTAAPVGWVGPAGGGVGVRGVW
jgi:hypothetical protein